MAGNVREWVLDEYHGSYTGAPTNELAWCFDIGICNTNTNIRMHRGGSWHRDISEVRSSLRGGNAPTSNGYYGLGFRVLRPSN
jgi:formylglycine-generating enzyme required for sulfatase activity